MDFNLYKTLPEWIFSRSLFAGMDIAVKEGQKISYETILAEGYISTSKYIVEISPKKNLDKMLVVSHGQLVSKGDIILKDKTSSPLEGVIDLSLSSENKLVIKSIPEYSILKSFMGGKVISVTPDEIKIEARAYRFLAPIILGNLTQGMLRNIGEETELNRSYKDSILVSDFITNSMVYKGRVVGVKGMLGKGIEVDILTDKKNEETAVASLCGCGRFERNIDFLKWESHFAEINPSNLSFVIAVNE